MPVMMYGARLLDHAKGLVERREQLFGGLMVAVSGLSFGTLSVFNRALAEAGVPVAQMSFLRFLGGAAVLWAIALSRNEPAPLPRGKLAGLFALGVLFVGEAWLYFESSRRIPIAVTAVLLYLFPALVALVSRVIFGERLGVVGLVALALSLSGTALVVGAPAGALEVLGVLLGVGSAVAYSGYVLVGSRVQPGVPPTFASAVISTSAAAVFAIGAIVQGETSFSGAASAWPSVVGLVLLGSVVPVPLLLFGMARIGANRASVISTLEPVSAAICGLLFLGETMTALQWLGAAAVVSAALVASRR
ncbi:MAG: EamA family transporter [Myxococcaceae bacterium]|nr:EamA family transporter [Myxococcaceae bacterium]